MRYPRMGSDLGWRVQAGIPPRAQGGPDEAGQVFLVAMGRAGPCAVPYGPDRLHRLHVMVVSPGETAELDAPLRLLTTLREAASLRSPEDAAPSLRVRPVWGEILRGASGRFYERIGDRIVPLHELAAGPRGEVLELSPGPEHGPRLQVVRPPPDAGEAPDTVEVEAEAVSTTAEPPSPAPPPRPTRAGQAAPPVPAAGQGKRCLVRWGDFRDMLAGQVAHPERIRDSHRLACCARIYRVRRPQRLDELAQVILGEPGPAGRLRVLDGGVAAQLGLAGLLGEEPARRDGGGRGTGWAQPGDLVFRLQLEVDPTAEVAAEDPGPGSADAPPSPPPPSPAPRTSIPRPFLGPLEFVRSREEALYLLSEEPGLVRGWLGRLWTRLTGRRELRRWRAMLQGRAVDEQLWRVRPPAARLRDRAVRDWARRALGAGGYDVERMLPEWEIYWTRKTPPR